ncbi:class I SAM-dependent methyltransferase [Yunchengibacter salinarum]|uniref:class I SAM-dependent methyltransferase n=1 Tax=Yunchengibacter salinarum TaxID=3133399 RepID=UPI0035B57711
MTQTSVSSEKRGLLPLARSVIAPRGLCERVFATLLDRARHGALSVDLPDGRVLYQPVRTKGPEARLTIRHPRAARRLILSGQLGFAEAYVNGDLGIDDPTSLFHWFIQNEAALDAPTRGSWLMARLARLGHLLRDNDRRGARRNIAYHYDLGNSFYEAWLDRSMTYSSALFQHLDEPLKVAQARKYATITDWLDPRPGDHLLEIGCGWGGFAEHLSRSKGTALTALTISEAQHAYARTRLAPLGRENSIRLQDYRDVTGRYNGIASIEMFEAVGEAHWPTYFERVKSLLADGGRAVIQVITIEDARFETYRKSADFIQRYIFPGGMLPSPTVFREHAARAGLTVTRDMTFGRSYGETLRRWRAAFETAWPRLESMGFDAQFRRLWRYYLAYCEAGFDSGAIDVGLYQLEHTD